MLNQEEIFFALDTSNRIPYNYFITLGHPYVYLIDSRINLFRGNNDRWAVAGERLGFTERGGGIELEITYFGNCLQNLESYNDIETNTYTIHPVDWDSFNESLGDTGFCLKPEAKYWLVGSENIPLNTNKQHYADNGIELKEYEPGEIGIEEAARLAVIHHRNAFRATDAQLYKSVPADLEKIMVLDEWYHRDFTDYSTPDLSADQIKSIYESSEQLQFNDISFETFASINARQNAERAKQKKKEWEENRPGAYETWQQLAKVLVTGDTSFYKPTLPPNTHWINWPESGSL